MAEAFDGFAAEIDADTVVNMTMAGGMELEAWSETERGAGPGGRKYSFKASDEDLAWYVHNETSQEQAKEWLDDDAVGTFLFRAGKGPNDLILNVKQDEGKDGDDTIYEQQVCVFVGPSKIMLYALDPNSGPYFRTLEQMAEKFKRTPYDHTTGHVLVIALPPGGAKAEQVTMKEALEAAEEVAAGGDGLLDIDVDPWYATPLAYSIYAIIFYFVLGMAFYTQYTDDNFTPFRGIEAIYFCIMVLTTVGYGDNPAIYKSNAAMLFTSFYVVFGVAVILTAATIIVQEMNKKREELKKKAQAKALKLLFDNSSEEDLERQLEEKMDSHKGNAEEKKTYWQLYLYWLETHPFAKSLIWVFVTMLTGMMVMTHIKVDHATYDDDDRFGNLSSTTLYFQTKTKDGAYTFVQALYWAVVTGTTVGFGDLTPDSDGAMIFNCIYIPVSMVCFMNMVGALQNKLRGAGELEDILGLELSGELISQIDKSGDGEVSKDEWLRAVLIALHKVDEELCDLILDHFDTLDTSKDGKLSKEDLEKGLGSGSGGVASKVSKAEDKTRKKSMKKAGKEKARAYAKKHEKDNKKGGRMGIKNFG